MNRPFRKTKWDTPKTTAYNAVAPPGSLQTSSLVTPATSTDSSVSSLEAASAAAAKINAVLASKGKLLIKKTKEVDKSRTPQNDPIIAEIEINDVPLHCRNMLTKRSMQDTISRESGAAVSTRGRYMKEEEKRMNKTGERPLYLFVQSMSLDKVDKAVNKFLDIIKNISQGVANRPRVTYKNISTPPSPVAGNVGGSGILPSVGNAFQEKVFVGLEHAHPSFNVKDKVNGPGGSFLNHIRTETGASVHLRGKGSGLKERASGRESFENLYIFITHQRQDSLQAAKKLCQNLVNTIQAEYVKFQSQLLGSPPPQLAVNTVGPPPVIPQYHTAPPPLGAMVPPPGSQPAAVVTVAAQTTPLVSTGHPVSSQGGQPLGVQPVSSGIVMPVNNTVVYPHLQRFQVPTQQPAMMTTPVPVGIPGAVPRQVAVLLQPPPATAGIQPPQQLPTGIQQPQLPPGMVVAPRLSTVVTPQGIVAQQGVVTPQGVVTQQRVITPQAVVTPQGLVPSQGIPVGVPPPTMTVIPQRPSLASTAVIATAAQEIRPATPLRGRISGFAPRTQTVNSQSLPPPGVVHLQTPPASVVQPLPTATLTNQLQALQNAPAVSAGHLQQPPPQLTTQQIQMILKGRQEAIQQAAQQQVAQQQAAQQQAIAQQQALQLQVAQQQAAAQQAVQQAAAQQQAVAQQQAAQQQAAQQAAAQAAQQQAAQAAVAQQQAAAQQQTNQQQLTAAQQTIAQHIAQQNAVRLQPAQQQPTSNAQQVTAQQQQAVAQQQQAGIQQSVAQQIATSVQTPVQPSAPPHVLQQTSPLQVQSIPQQPSEIQQQVSQGPPPSLFQAPPPSQLPPHSQTMQVQVSPTQLATSQAPASQTTALQPPSQAPPTESQGPPASSAPTSHVLNNQAPVSQGLNSQAPLAQGPTSQAPVSHAPTSQTLSHPMLAHSGALSQHFSQGAIPGPPPTQSIPASSIAASAGPTSSMETPIAPSVVDAQRLQELQQQTSQPHLIQSQVALTQQVQMPASQATGLATSAPHAVTPVVSSGLALGQSAVLQYPLTSGGATTLAPSSQEHTLGMGHRYDEEKERDLHTGSHLRGEEDNGYGRRRRFREDFELEDKPPKSLRSSEYERSPYGSRYQDRRADLSRGLEMYGRRRRFQEEAGDGRRSFDELHRQREERVSRFSEATDRRLMPPPPPSLSSRMATTKSMLSSPDMARPGYGRPGPLDSLRESPSGSSDRGDSPASGNPSDNWGGISSRLSATERMFMTPASRPEGGLAGQPQVQYSPPSSQGILASEPVTSPLDLRSAMTSSRIGLQTQDPAQVRAQQTLSGAQPFWMARH